MCHSKPTVVHLLSSFLIPLSCSLFPLSSFPQSITLPGVITIQNSEYETGKRIYVNGASVRAPFAKPVSSDGKGQFVLVFSGVQPGVPVRLTVSKAGLEVVNSKETEQVILGRVPQLRVVMADPEKLANAQLTYYHIAFESISKRFEERIAALRAENARLQAEWKSGAHGAQQAGPTLGEALDSLTQQRDQALQDASTMAQRIAMVDLDEVSALYRRAFRLFQNGEVDSMLLVLSNEQLEKDYLEASENKRRTEANAAIAIQEANRRVRQVLQTHQLKFETLKATMELAQAMDVLDRMDAIVHDNMDVFGPEQRIKLISDRGIIHCLQGHVEMGASLTGKAVELADSLLPANDPVRITLLEDHAIALSGAGDFPGSNDALRRAILVGTMQEHPDIARMGRLHVLLSGGYYDQGDLQAALEEARTAIELAEQDTVITDHTFRSMAYIRMGNLHLATGDVSKGIVETGIGFRIARDRMDKRSPELANAYLFQASALVFVPDPKAAIQYADTCLMLQVATFGQEHPAIGITQLTRALIMDRFADITGERSAISSALAIQSKVYGEEHPILANTYVRLASVLRLTGSLDSALIVVKKALRIQLAQGEDAPFDAAQTYYLLGQTYVKLGLPDSALIPFDRGRQIALRTMGERSSDTRMNLAAKGRALVDMGRYEGARSVLRQAIAEYDSAGAQYSWGATSLMHDLGELHVRTNAYDSALVALEKERSIYAAINAGSDPEALVNLADLAYVEAHLGDAHRPDQVIDSVITALEGTYVDLGGGMPRLLLLSSEVAAGCGSFDKAIERARSAVTAALKVYHSDHPIVVRARNRLASVLYDQGRSDEARTELDISWSVKPSADAALLNYRMAMDGDQESVALDWIVRCARLRNAWPGTLPEERTRTMSALRSLASKRHRKDLLKEFELN